MATWRQGLSPRDGGVKGGVCSPGVPDLRGCGLLWGAEQVHLVARRGACLETRRGFSSLP